jgi:hypothetical protein
MAFKNIYSLCLTSHRLPSELSVELDFDRTTEDDISTIIELKSGSYTVEKIITSESKKGSNVIVNDFFEYGGVRMVISN